MGSALRVIGRSFRDWWDEMFTMVGVNLVWALLALPIVTLPPATMGAIAITNEKAHGRRIEFDMFWQGFRRYFGKAWALGGINVLVTLLIVVNIVFYANQPSWLFYLTIIWLYGLLIWLGVTLYTFPLALEQEEKGIKLIYRNAALMALGRPLFTFVVVLLQVVLLAVSIVLSPLLLLVYIPLSSLVSNHALLSGLEEIEKKREGRIAALKREPETEEEIEEEA